MNESDDTATRARKARQSSPFLTAKQTAFYLGLSGSTLKGMRSEGRGPVCRMHGHAYYYHIDEIDAWSNARKKGDKDA
ncbi:helix-turn-helix domain-containing protein [Sphingomonas sp. BIUV-7]|uniref:Helix-turn-helix domain-containing protein n=1 Tax=Sphingomonas natans TaxID=3063330 RepID=A0ABT8YE71_9SPHN|nr:helix-turn-helix domain-containing protein [Sphingomonas sp. BIUV-7]MDO6416247.1 helix-turn-helix domain-containing protein [Sphingomonas sp. BIUV-7]